MEALPGHLLSLISSWAADAVLNWWPLPAFFGGSAPTAIGNWIIDVGKKAVNIYKLPAQEHNYARESHTYGVIAPQAFPDVTVDLKDIF